MISGSESFDRRTSTTAPRYFEDGDIDVDMLDVGLYVVVSKLW